MRTTTLLVCVGLVALPARALAQNGANIDLQAFKPAMDSRGFITVNASEVLDPRQVSFGLVTNWARNLLRFRNGDNTFEVSNLISPTLVGAVGLRLGQLGFAFGVSLPFQVLDGDRAPDSDNMTPNNPNDDRNYRFDGQGMGDLGLHLKTRLVDNRAGGIGVAAIASVYLPTASETGAWLGDRAFVPQLMLVADRRLGRLHLAVNAGVRVRARDHVFVDSATDMPTTGQRIDVGSTLPFGAGLSYALAPRKIDLVGELIGGVPLGGENYQPLEAIAGFKVYLAKSSYLTLGGGMGLVPDKGANPDFRAFVGIVFEPRSPARVVVHVPDRVEPPPPAPAPEPDRDGDGIVDKDDQCPDDREDKDGFEDQDGCPDIDNDKDGILDVDDLCPNEPENKNGNEDDDGCPDKDISVRTHGVIKTLESIHFKFDSAEIRRRSYHVLDAVAKTIKDNPDIALLEIQGHTDSRGSDVYNLRLSRARARSVRRYLIRKGIAPSRLVAKGYGERVPLDRANTEAAYAKNRRVEFVIRDTL